MNEEVHIQATVTDPDGTTRFTDETLPLDRSLGPLRLTAPIPAVAMSFRWTPGSFDFDFHTAPRKRLVLVTEGALEITVGSGERRLFRPGDILCTRDTWGQGHQSRAVDTQPFRSAFIALDDERQNDRRERMTPPYAGAIDFVHNKAYDDGTSYYEARTLPYVFGGTEGKETGEFPLTAFQFVNAPGDLDFDWHPAPQKQIVLALTGGLVMEYGDGTQVTVEPGGFLIGEDTHGPGHITRALQGAQRLSVFAHLDESRPPPV